MIIFKAELATVKLFFAFLPFLQGKMDFSLVNTSVETRLCGLQVSRVFC